MMLDDDCVNCEVLLMGRWRSVVRMRFAPRPPLAGLFSPGANFIAIDFHIE